MNQYSVDSDDPRARFVLGVDNEGRQRVLIAAEDLRDGEPALWQLRPTLPISPDDFSADERPPFVQVIAQPDTVTVEMPRVLRDACADEAWGQGEYVEMVARCRASRDAEANQ